MVKKLTSLLTDRSAWRLLFKVGLAVLVLFAASRFDFAFLPALVLIAFFLFIYFSGIPERKLFRFSYFLFVFLSVVGIGSFSGSNLFLAIGLLAFAVFFFILLGLIEIIFTERFLIYGIFNTLLLLIVFLIFFFFGGKENIWILEIGLFSALFLIFKEVFHFFNIWFGKRTALAAGILALLGTEFASVVALLPLGFINSAVFLVLIMILIRDSLTVHFQGFLNTNFVLRQFTFLVVFTLIIFAFSGWSP